MSTYVKKTWTIEHSWTCKHCQNVNKGREDKCVECGKPIDSSHEETIPEDMSYENRVTDTKKFEENKQPDWICGYCDHRNPSSLQVCKECAGSKEGKKSTVRNGLDTLEVKNIPTPEPFVNDEAKVFGKGIFVELPKASKQASQTGGTHYRDSVFQEPKIVKPSFFRRFSKESLFKFFLFVVVGFVAFGIAWLINYLFSWHPTIAKVTQTTWNYHVTLHQRQINHGHDWRNEEPIHSFNEVCQTEIRGFHPCHPHECNPHNTTYDCNCRSVESCSTRESCRTSCSNSGNRSSSCSETCRPVESCTFRTVCQTCNKTEYDTCYDRCPDYDQMCDFDFPVWPEINHADFTNSNHLIVRPSLTAQGNKPCSQEDMELVYTQNNSIVQCTEDIITFKVEFDALEVNGYTITPRSISEYNRYQTESLWLAQYNHAGMFQILGPK